MSRLVSYLITREVIEDHFDFDFLDLEPIFSGFDGFPEFSFLD
jgi:hypothetical protein